MQSLVWWLVLNFSLIVSRITLDICSRESLWLWDIVLNIFLHWDRKTYPLWVKSFSRQEILYNIKWTKWAELMFVHSYLLVSWLWMWWDQLLQAPAVLTFSLWEIIPWTVGKNNSLPHKFLYSEHFIKETRNETKTVTGTKKWSFGCNKPDLMLLRLLKLSVVIWFGFLCGGEWKSLEI